MHNLMILIVIIVICVILYRKSKKVQLNKKPKNIKYPYHAVNLLTPAEKLFYNALKNAIGTEYSIMCKVRLEDIINVKRNANNYMSHRGRIKSRHIDFVIVNCDIRTVCTIELNDRSHNRPDRRQRDKFIREALSSAGIILHEITCRRSYDPEMLKKLIMTQKSQSKSNLTLCMSNT